MAKEKDLGEYDSGDDDSPEEEEPEYSDEEEEQQERDMRSEELDIIKEQELEKKEQAIYNFNQIRLNSENILKVIQIQLTKVLMDIQEIEKDIERETSQYWMRDLPVQNYINHYLRNISTLINLYTQQEQIYKKGFEAVFEALEFPEFLKIEEAYINKINEVREKIDILKTEFSKQAEEMKFEWETKTQERLKKEIAKVHFDYEGAFTEAEFKLEERDREIEGYRKLIKSLIDSKEPILIKDFNQKSQSLMNEKKDGYKIVDDSDEEPKMAVTPPAVYKDDKSEKEVFNNEELEYSKLYEKERFGDSSVQQEKHYLIKAFYNKTGASRDEFGNLLIPNEKLFEDGIMKLILDLSLINKTYEEIRRMLSREFSPTTFYKYVNRAVENGMLIREGKGDEMKLLINPLPDKLKQKGEKVNETKQEQKQKKKRKYRKTGKYKNYREADRLERAAGKKERENNK